MAVAVTAIVRQWNDKANALFAANSECEGPRDQPP